EFIHQGKEDGPGLIIVAHSLGTVIALDYLGNWRCHDSGRDVALVTMGSPYRRYFLTWLPGVLFDESLENTVGRTAARYHSFRWVNVYRPWDYIGTSLGLTRSGLGTDQSTRQRLRLNGHAGYWADDTVLAIVATALRSAPTPVSPH